MIIDPIENKCNLSDSRYPETAYRGLPAASDPGRHYRPLSPDHLRGATPAKQTPKQGNSTIPRDRTRQTVDIVELIHLARTRFGAMASCSPDNQPADHVLAQFQHSSLEVFVEGVAHHFNNLFMAIQGYVSLLMRDADPHHPEVAHLLRIEKLVHGESILTNDLLRFLIGRPCRISTRDQNHLLQEIGTVASIVGAAAGERSVALGRLSVSSPPEQILRTLSVSMAYILDRLLSEIREQATLLHGQAGVDSQKSRRIEKILQLAGQGLRPVCQLLGYAGRTAVPNGHRVARQNLVQAVRETVERNDHKIRLFVDVDADLPKMKVQHRQLAEILLAVVDNAAEAMSPGDDLYFEAVNMRPEQIDEPGWHVPAKPFVRMTFSDCGSGFDPRFGRLIFEPFFTNKGRIGHYGLGLSNIYGMVDTLGGYIGVETEPGRGTNMHIYLPSEPSGNPVRDHLACPQSVLPADNAQLGQVRAR